MPLLPARLTALPRRAKPCSLRPYHCPRDYHNLLRFLPSSSSFSSSFSSSSVFCSSILNSQRIALATCGVRARRCRAPLFFRTHPPPPPPLQDFINRASCSTRGAMTATKIDGTVIAKDIRAGLKTEIEQIQQANPRFKPSLVIFQGRFSVRYQYQPDRRGYADIYDLSQLAVDRIRVSFSFNLTRPFPANVD